jgi:hypothetical protein
MRPATLGPIRPAFRQRLLDPADLVFGGEPARDVELLQDRLAPVDVPQPAVAPAQALQEQGLVVSGQADDLVEAVTTSPQLRLVSSP